MSEQMTQTIPDVRKWVTVPATPQQAFAVFTEQPEQWWPASHVLLDKERVGLAFEPGVGGRYYEWDADGRQIDWGRILDWLPGRRIVMTWRINASWQSIPTDDGASLIEVDFEPDGDGGTRVTLAHVQLHRHGEGADRIFRALDGPSPGETLELFERAVRSAQ
ncbi:SRPBCC family protein [Streptomyces candidus]|uniref:Uncharacterized protein YndB with AHSA1/START domain n=1 Tax=Streptomyces candidus TaxID=67283 RepID=A0A7X0HFP2_9ACTN|nr:SRPBCC family protein [Streptomyces candidus]MBB6436676.1 uncharacterized protein YndB with AHSA1/START domain [Streptomyces candidus]GHH51021.1 hypothetical protein GCM10018773_48890 [Streptomyces candidus]